MRSDAQARESHLRWQEAELAAAAQSAGVVRFGRFDNVFEATLDDVVYLAISRASGFGLMEWLPGAEGRFARRMWKPSSLEDVVVIQSSLEVAVTLMADEEGMPQIVILPGGHRPILHPHVSPDCRRPAWVCLGGAEWRPGVTTVTDLLAGLVRMLRFEPGTYSTDPGRAVNLGAAQWLEEGDGREIPLPLEPAGITCASSVRVLSRTP